MSKLYLAFFTLLTLSFSLPIGEEKAWDYSNKLTWNDYKAEPDHASEMSAFSYITLSCNSVSGNLMYIDLKVEAKFHPEKSWVKEIRNDKEYLLGHEQRHFDIGEIYRRKMVQSLKNFEFSRKTLQRDLDAITKSVYTGHEETQERYDLETNHSLEKDIQEKWDAFIDREIDKLKPYETQLVRVYF